MLTGTNPAGRKLPPPVALRGRLDGAPVACVTRRGASDRAGEDQLTCLCWLSVWSSSCGGRPCSTRRRLRAPPPPGTRARPVPCCESADWTPDRAGTVIDRQPGATNDSHRHACSPSIASASQHRRQACATDDSRQSTQSPSRSRIRCEAVARMLSARCASGRETLVPDRARSRRPVPSGVSQTTFFPEKCA